MSRSPGNEILLFYQGGRNSKRSDQNLKSSAINTFNIKRVYFANLPEYSLPAGDFRNGIWAENKIQIIW